MKINGIDEKGPVRPVIIIGAGGHGKVVADIVQKSGDRVAGFLDDHAKPGGRFIGLPVFGAVDQYQRYRETAAFVIAVGNAAAREEIAEKLRGAAWYTAVHPSAVIAGIGVCIGEGTVVAANAVINAGSRIGRHCIINTAAVVEHDNIIEDFAHISVGAKLAGTVRIGKGSWIGIGASVRNNLNICGGWMIGAGAAVVQNIDKAGTYTGVPARMLKRG